MTVSRTSHQPTTAEGAPVGEAGLDGTPGVVTGDEGPELTSEMLVEEVSIDGMCGVY